MSKAPKESSKVLKDSIRTLWYNSALEIIKYFNTTDGKDENESKKKFTGTDKKTKKQWDTLEHRNEGKKKKEFASPVSINFRTLAYIMKRINDKDIPKLSTEKKVMIQKHSSLDWRLDESIKKHTKGTGLDVDTIVSYIKYIAFISASVAYNSNKKFSLKKEMLMTFDTLIMT